MVQRCGAMLVARRYDVFPSGWGWHHAGRVIHRFPRLCEI